MSDAANLADAAAKLEVADDPEAEAAAADDEVKKKKKAKKKKKKAGGGEDAGDDAAPAAAEAAQDAGGEAAAGDNDGEADGEGGDEGGATESASKKKREKKKAAAARKKAAAEAEAAAGGGGGAALGAVGADAAWQTEIRGIGRWRCFPDCEPSGGVPQTWPPTVPVIAQFPSGNVPCGELCDYRDDNRRAGPGPPGGRACLSPPRPLFFAGTARRPKSCATRSGCRGPRTRRFGSPPSATGRCASTCSR